MNNILIFLIFYLIAWIILWINMIKSSVEEVGIENPSFMNSLLAGIGMTLSFLFFPAMLSFLQILGVILGLIIGLFFAILVLKAVFHVKYKKASRIFFRIILNSIIIIIIFVVGFFGTLLLFAS